MRSLHRFHHLFCLCRPEYGYLMNIASYFPDVPLMALTATATPAIQEQLLTMLRDPIKEIATINKPNISLHATELTKLPKKGMFLLEVMNAVRSQFKCRY